jgi:hypothetical protein
VPAKSKASNEEHVHGADVVVEQRRRCRLGVARRVRGGVRRDYVVLDVGRRELARKLDLVEVAADVRHREVLERAAVHAVAQHGRREGGDVRVDHGIDRLFPELDLRVAHFGDRSEADRPELVSRERLVAEPEVDVGVVRRPVVDVPVRIVEREPLRLDHGLDLGLVVGLHPPRKRRFAVELARRAPFVATSLERIFHAAPIHTSPSVCTSP